MTAPTPPQAGGRKPQPDESFAPWPAAMTEAQRLFIRQLGQTLSLDAETTLRDILYRVGANASGTGGGGQPPTHSFEEWHDGYEPEKFFGTQYQDALAERKRYRREGWDAAVSVLAAEVQASRAAADAGDSSTVSMRTALERIITASADQYVVGIARRALAAPQRPRRQPSPTEAVPLRNLGGYDSRRGDAPPRPPQPAPTALSAEEMAEVERLYQDAPFEAMRRTDALPAGRQPRPPQGRQSETCYRCNGDGQIPCGDGMVTSCQACDGTGHIAVVAAEAPTPAPTLTAAERHWHADVRGRQAAGKCVTPAERALADACDRLLRDGGGAAEAGAEAKEKA